MPYSRQSLLGRWVCSTDGISPSRAWDRVVNRWELWLKLQTGFGEIDVSLDPAQDFIVDDVFVAKLQNHVAFQLEGFGGEAFVFG